MTSLVRAGPDAASLLGYALELGSMIKQLREQDERVPILSFQVMEEPKVREIAGPAAEGVVFTSPTIYGEFATGKSRQFIDAYQKQYGAAPGIFAANAYDAVNVLAKVLGERGFEMTGIQAGLRDVKGFEGASGTFDINAKGDSNQQPRFLVIRGGKIELLNSEGPN
jgi:branched-chain amino acid transport system substrate-binding protein